MMYDLSAPDFEKLCRLSLAASKGDNRFQLEYVAIRRGKNGESVACATSGKILAVANIAIDVDCDVFIPAPLLASVKVRDQFSKATVSQDVITGECSLKYGQTIHGWRYEEFTYPDFSFVLDATADDDGAPQLDARLMTIAYKILGIGKKNSAPNIYHVGSTKPAWLANTSIAVAVMPLVLDKKGPSVKPRPAVLLHASSLLAREMATV